MNQRIETAFVVGAPLTLAVLELFHPQPHDLFGLDLRAWMAVHYAQILLFPLTALALATLVRHRQGFAAALCRGGAFVFGVTWIAFDSVAGVATGILLRNAEASAAPETWRAPVMSIWAHPIVGGAPDTVPLRWRWRDPSRGRSAVSPRPWRSAAPGSPGAPSCCWRSRR